MSDFKIKTETFEGPLDLLLSFIEKRKLLINEISLAKITDDYLSHIQLIGDHSIGDRAEFIVIASTLLLIKSRSLLPNLSLSDEEEQNISDLEDRLKLYQKVKELGEHIKNSYGKNILFEKTFHKDSTAIFSPHEKITIGALFQSMKDVVGRIPVKNLEPKVLIKKVISIEEMMDRLTERVQKALKVSFKGASTGKMLTREEKVETIVGFLAILEMFKQGIVDIRQDSIFGDIEMHTSEVGTPQYN
ncbi:MAG: segregation/condensation protein A [bacterium]